MGRLRDYASSFDPPPPEKGELHDERTGLRRFLRRKKVPAPRAKRMVLVLVLVLAVYFILIGQRGVELLRDPQITLKVLGIAVLILPLVGAWVVVAELRFGVATQILAERLDEEGAEPEPPLPMTPAGRLDRDAADALFEQRKAAVETDSGNWRAWYRLALAYDYAGDRKRAREAMRTAIEHADLSTPPRS
ncbi:MAG TPA: tetratricopeptide repeat protein [Jatrophihabitans sp.]|jgi:tetratricopeptide (TPR) repeat protein